MCSDAYKRQFGTLRSRPDKILTVITLLTEGMGVRAAGGLLSKQTPAMESGIASNRLTVADLLTT